MSARIVSLLGVLVACGRSELDYDYAPSDSFCAGLSPRPLFCDDFDTGSLTKWTRSNVLNGELTVTGADFISSPRALDATITTGAANAQTVKSFDGWTGFTRVTISFDMRADLECFTESTQVDGITVMSVQSTVSQFLIQLDVTGTVTSVTVGFPDHRAGFDRRANSAIYVTPIPNGVWSHVRIDVDVSEGRIAIATNGVTTTKAFDGWVSDSAILDNPVVSLGVAGGVTPCTSLFDNFVFDAH